MEVTVEVAKADPCALPTDAQHQAPENPQDLIETVEGAKEDAVQNDPIVVKQSDGNSDHAEEAVRPTDEGQETRSQPEEIDKVLPRYRTPVHTLPKSRETARRTNGDKQSSTTPSVTDLTIRVNLVFDRYGFCSICFLPERSDGLDSEVPVKLGGKSYLLLGEDNSYAGFRPENAGQLLRDGIELKAVLADERRIRWLLTGRDLYVLASSKLAGGFVSTNRLALGRSHVVLCATELIEKVETFLSEAGCTGHERLGESEGIPAGWIGLRNVRPTKALSLEPGSDPFYPIKPAPDIEIDLDGGIWLGGSAWLAGYPPEIKILGESTIRIGVLIDGKEALRTADGSLEVAGYDLPGSHSVYCEGLACSRSYSIDEAPQSWEHWSAYRFAKTSLCGPLVEVNPGNGWRLVTVPMSNPVLLGAEPGQIFHCSRRSVPLWKGMVPFDVVWALPAQPLRSDKRSARIVQLSAVSAAVGVTNRKGALEWSVAILDASRKGLKIENNSAHSAEMWRDYKKLARCIWRFGR